MEQKAGLATLDIVLDEKMYFWKIEWVMLKLETYEKLSAIHGN